MQPRVVIIGGGFGGLYAARKLRKVPVQITLLDRRNYHLFQPLLYQVATAELNPSDIAQPIRHVLRKQRNVEVMLAEALAIDRHAKQVTLPDGPLFYDYLIVAPGSSHSYFGHEDWGAFAPGLKSIEDATAARSRILLAFEAAERETRPARRRAWLTFVVVGAGPTGVEMAGAMADISRRVLVQEFRNIDPADAHILLVEAGPRILPAWAPELADKARRDLEDLGVEVVTGVPVTEVDGDSVKIGDRRVPARTVIWAAGVAASPLARSLDTPLDKSGRVLVAPDLSVPGSPEVFVIGDLARLDQDGRPLPGLAPVAIQQGEHAARNIARAVAGQPPLPFHYRDKGALAIIGRTRAIADIRGRRFDGLLAFLVWAFVHILWLIGFRNRFFVMAEWAWAWLRRERGARLITAVTPPAVTPGREPRRAPTTGARVPQPS